MLNVPMTHYVDQFHQREQKRGHQWPAWLRDARKDALSVFTENGFPTMKAEEWKYTNIGPIAKSEFRSSDAAPDVSSDFVQSCLVHGIDQHVITFVDGHFSREHSTIDGLPDGTVVTDLMSAAESHEAIVQQYLLQYAEYRKNPFTALNTAFLNNGVFVHIPESVSVDKPVHLLFISTGPSGQTIAPLRNLIVAEENSKANFLCSYYSAHPNKNLTSVVSEIVAKKNSRVEFIKVQRESETSFHVENLVVHQSEASSVHVFSLALGGAIARNDMSVIIDGEAAECNLNGLYIASGEQLLDHHTFMHHIHPNCPSHELFKGILTDNSRAVFNGKVYVEPEAQKTDSKQTNRNLLLSDTAVVDTKPELEIFADDVKCTHGAAVGGLNDTYMFYLKSRGIPPEVARTMLTVGFAAEVTGKITDTTLRHHVDLMVVDHLKSKLHAANLPEIVHN